MHMRNNSGKIRVNITIDKNLLMKAKKKLDLFGGKLSTLFNAYLSDFVKTSEQQPFQEHSNLMDKIKSLEIRIKRLEEKIK